MTDSNSTERRILSWLEIEVACKLLSEKIRRRALSNPQIAAVQRGGLVPATIISYETGIPISFIIDPVDYGEALTASTRQREIRDLIIIDDVADTGATFSVVGHYFPHALLAAPYCKPQGRALCDLWIEEVPQTCWIQFPWGE